MVAYFAMDGLAPNGATLADAFAALHQRRGAGDTEVLSPSFEADTALDLTDALKELGVRTVFEGRDLLACAAPEDDEPQPDGRPTTAIRFLHAAQVTLSDRRLNDPVPLKTPRRRCVDGRTPCKASIRVDKPFSFLITEPSSGAVMYAGWAGWPL
jgi:hypothetical protein